MIAFLFVSGGIIALCAGFAKLLKKHRDRTFGILVRLALWFALAAVLLWKIQVNPASPAVVVVRYENSAILRAECPGFIRQLHCEHGQRVVVGQLLVTAENLEETSALTTIELDLNRAELRSLRYLAAGKTSSWEAEQEVVKSLRNRFSAQSNRVASLEFRAPVTGRVHAPRLTSMSDRFLGVGQQLLMIFPEEPPSLLVSASQRDSQHFNNGDAIRVRLRGRPEDLSATLTKIEKRATSAIPHPALAATAGGPLAVVGIADQSGGNRSGIARETFENESQRHFSGLNRPAANTGRELAGARIAAIGALDSTNPNLELAEGEWGYARLNDGQSVSAGSWMWQWIVRYVRAKFGAGR
ncbi:MAG: multidrug resistance efflux pump [Verrucomicrobiales bacterium]